MTPNEVQSWLDRYVEAWSTDDRDTDQSPLLRRRHLQISPVGRRPLDGADAIADDWLANPDEPGTWEASYALSSSTATGDHHRELSYTNGRVFWNLWEVDFDDAGRCIRFVEWFMRQPLNAPRLETWSRHLVRVGRGRSATASGRRRVPFAFSTSTTPVRSESARGR